eukprot:CAMPEP_0202084648 /NCGR_PEP_ID=MMETSP0964-20121228/28269_1 /ASSEMBLY_ACC=CAM_ASM_000500 /TAXON_ID=4773 /ORGANISM="Schizochytrium aggregatum, Strain ATCC28209" /LENGTH=413 /DNA_ID=CAMNT_0048652441 /DNA_START=257 /DNA_END=1495 /DNA_ORIENTATION=+
MEVFAAPISEMYNPDWCILDAFCELCSGTKWRKRLRDLTVKCNSSDTALKLVLDVSVVRERRSASRGVVRRQHGPIARLELARELMRLPHAAPINKFDRGVRSVFQAEELPGGKVAEEDARGHRYASWNPAQVMDHRHDAGPKRTTGANPHSVWQCSCAAARKAATLAGRQPPVDHDASRTSIALDSLDKDGGAREVSRLELWRGHKNCARLQRREGEGGRRRRPISIAPAALSVGRRASAVPAPPATRGKHPALQAQAEADDRGHGDLQTSVGDSAHHGREEQLQDEDDGQRDDCRPQQDGGARDAPDPMAHAAREGFPLRGARVRCLANRAIRGLGGMAAAQAHRLPGAQAVEVHPALRAAAVARRHPARARLLRLRHLLLRLRGRLVRPGQGRPWVIVVLARQADAALAG